MDVSIKSFDVEMAVKNKGIELEISEPNDGKRLGDLVITKSHLIWCEGKTRRENGQKIKWTEFVAIVNSIQKPAKAKKAASKKAPSGAKKVSAKTAPPVAEPAAE